MLSRRLSPREERPFREEDGGKQGGRILKKGSRGQAPQLSWPPKEWLLYFQGGLSSRRLISSREYVKCRDCPRRLPVCHPPPNRPFSVLHAIEARLSEVLRAGERLGVSADEVLADLRVRNSFKWPPPAVPRPSSILPHPLSSFVTVLPVDNEAVVNDPADLRHSPALQWAIKPNGPDKRPTFPWDGQQVARNFVNYRQRGEFCSLSWSREDDKEWPQIDVICLLFVPEEVAKYPGHPFSRTSPDSYCRDQKHLGTKDQAV